MTLQENFNQFIELALNEPQKQAVQQPTGANLVVAGAGSGKTRVITSRMANLVLNNNVDPRSIIALTFTNKAAGEMKERLYSFLGTDHSLPFVGTFHSYCLLLLRLNAKLLPMAQFSIIDSDDQQSLIKKILKKHGLTKYVAASQVGYQISQYKNTCFLDSPDPVFTAPYIKEVYLEYESEKTGAHCLDFDDLILTVLSLFKNNESFKKSHQNKVRHILVDEYQDTNHAQHALLKYMSLDEKKQFSIDSLCAVGDEDQSIYSWRGATVTNMLNFKSDFAPVTCIKIEQNYRSVQPILQTANSVITNNTQRNPKNLWSTKPATNRIVLGYCRSGEQEAEALVHFLKARPSDKALNDIAILYRTHYQSRSIEEALLYHSIPYKIIGGIQFYERKEIKDLLAYLRMIVNPYDKISLMRVINCPARGLGEKFEQQLFDLWQNNSLLTFHQLLTWVLEENPIHLTPSKTSSVKEFLAVFDGLLTTPYPLASNALNLILEQTQYVSYLRNEYDPTEADAKVENVREFAEAIIYFEQNKKTEESPWDYQTQTQTIEAFLHEVALMQEKIKDTQGTEQVQMMTLHAAKGLEFDTVIITGLEEGLLPSSKSLNSNEALEEERRLFYVGITRAKEYLLLLSASYRHSFGQITDQSPSRFISEMPSEHVTTIDIEKMHATQSRSFFSQWVGNTHTSSPLVTFGPARQTRETSKTINTFTKSTKLPEPQELKKQNTWAKSNNVIHKKFGLGIVLNVEDASDGQHYLTIAFKTGTKKILSSFVQKR